MRKSKFMLCIFLCIVMMATFCSCASNGNKMSPSEAMDAAKSGTNQATVSTNFKDGLKVEKIGEIDNAYSMIVYEAGIVYSDNNHMYGIMSLDGKQDTGTIYTYVQNMGSYFITSRTNNMDYTDVSTLNSFNLVDVTGKKVVDSKYANFRTYSDRFVEVTTVTGITQDEDESVYEGTDSNNEKIMFSGYWEIYDVENGKLIPGCKCVDRYYDNEARENVFAYYDDEGKWHKYNADKEEEVTEAVLSNGDYIVENKSENTIYTKDGNKIFDYDGGVYTAEFVSGDYYVFSSRNGNGDKLYTIMDNTGLIISEDYKSNIEITDDFVVYSDGIYSVDKELLYDGYNNIDKIEVNNTYILSSSNLDNLLLVDAEGILLAKIPYDSDDCSYSTYGSFCEKDSNENLQNKYFSYKDLDYTVVADSATDVPFVVYVMNDNGTYDVIDLITNEVLIENYTDFRHSISGKSNYIYAQNADGSYDVYLITAE